MNSDEQQESRFLERFGSLVRSRRLELGLTQQEAYQTGGMTNKTWKRIEDGLPVKPFTIVALDRVFGEEGGTMMRFWEHRDIEGLARHWGMPSSPPVTAPPLVTEPQPDIAVPEPDIHLEVGTKQYDESLRFLLRHDSDSLRLLSAPVYQAMRYRARAEQVQKILDLKQEITQATEALKGAASDKTADYLQARIDQLTHELRGLEQEDVLGTSLIGMLRRTDNG